MPNTNYALADGLLLEARKYFCPVNISLSEIKTVRTEKDILDEFELKHFNYRVKKIMDKLQDWDMPPPII